MDGGGNTGSTDQMEFNEPPPYAAATITITTIHSSFMKHVVVTAGIILDDSILYIVYASYYGSDSMP